MKQPEQQNDQKTIGENQPSHESAPISQAKSSVSGPQNLDGKFKKIFFISLAAMLAIFWISGFNVGFHVDEMDMNNYCKKNYQFYFSGGKDTSYLDASATPSVVRRDTLLRYYGSAFDYLPVGFNKITGLDNGRNEFNSRHIFNQFFAVLCILFSGLIAVMISGWRAAVFVQWLLFLTPVFFGNALFNTKDIPFCTGFTAALYFLIVFLQQLPVPSWKTTLTLMLSIAFTVGTRMGGLLIIFYCCLFISLCFITNKVLQKDMMKNAGSLTLKMFLLIFGAIAIAVLSWPFLLSNPFRNVPATIDVINKFPGRIPLPFEGNFISSDTLPWYYLPKFMFITIPVFIIASFFIGTIVVFVSKKLNRQVIYVVLFACIFPVVYAMVRHVAMYSAWRHFLFVYPGIAIISGVGLSELVNSLRKPVLKIAFVLLCLAAMYNPIMWSLKNHPYEYTYFNEIEGGFEKAYSNYETDYWEISAKKAIDWLFKNEPIRQAKDTVNIISNLGTFTDYYIKRNYPGSKVTVTDGGFKYRSYSGWTYGLFNRIFLHQDVMDKDFPPIGTIYTSDIDSKPLTVVIRDTNRYDAQAIIDVYLGRFRGADSLFNLYLQYADRGNLGLYGYIGITKAMGGETDAALYLGKRAIEFDDNNPSGYMAVGLAYWFKKDIEKALYFFEQAYFLTTHGKFFVFVYSDKEFVTKMLRQLDPELLKKVQYDVLQARTQAPHR